MKVSIIMGSLSDSPIADKVVSKLMEFGIDYEVKVISAHRALKSLEKYVKESEEESEVYIGIAGKAAHLSGVIAALTTRPVIGIPAKSSHLGGLEAKWRSCCNCCNRWRRKCCNFGYRNSCNKIWFFKRKIKGYENKNERNYR